MPEIIPGAPLHSFLDALRKATSDTFSQALGAPWSVELATTEAAPSAQTSVVRFQVSMSGGLQGNASILVGSGDALLLTQKFGAESIDPSAELNQDRQDALRGLLRQIAVLATNSLKGLFRETELEVGPPEMADGQAVDVALLASEPSVGTLSLGLRLSPELLASLSPAKPPASAPVAGSDPIPSVSHEPNFDLLLGVNLNLTLRFGQRILPLREILDLTSGSVIELDREVQEPADLLLGDKLIARGEVVIVDGNYGIRITEVADAGQRIGTL
jgi:flagellar motor switch protein FliN